MGFLDKLAADPGNSSIYNPGGGSTNVDYGPALHAINQLRDREMNDFKAKANFTNELSLRQPRLQQIYGAPPNQQQSNQDTSNMNVVLGHNTNEITPFQKAGLDIDKQKLGLESARISQSGKLGEERIGVQKATHELNEKKNQQIYETKQADMQRKVDESNAKLELAQRALEQKGNDSKALQEYRNAKEEAHQAQLDLINHQKDTQIENLQKAHDDQMKATQDRLDAAKEPTTETTEINADGTKKTVTKSKGAKRIQVVGPNGQSGTVDASETLPTGWKAK